jgi:hypothetical protein
MAVVAVLPVVADTVWGSFAVVSEYPDGPVTLIVVLPAGTCTE